MEWLKDWRIWIIAAIALVGFGYATIPKAHAAGFGCHGTIIGGMAATKTNTAIDTNLGGPATMNIANVNGLGSNGSLVGLGAGCDWTVDKFVLGAFTDYVWHNGQEINANLLMASVTMGFDRQWTVGGRAGFMVTDSTLAYALLGWTKLTSTGISGIVSAGVPDFTGTVMGAGIETTVSKHVKIGLEWRHTAFDAQTVSLAVPLAPPGFVLTSRLAPEMDTAMLRLSVGTDFFGAK